MNVRQLKPVELLRLLNTTGTRVSESRLRRDRERAGYNIGDDKTVDLLKYAAFLALEYDSKKAAPTRTVVDSYEATKAAARDRASESVRAAQEIGELPPVANPERKRRAGESFMYFCLAYFRIVFDKPFSQMHRNVIAKLERVVRNGEIYALVMPRGSGKSTLNKLLVLWAALYGYTEFIMLVAASGARAQKLLEELKVWLETNPLLYADFPEVCVAIRKLERVAHRQKGQRFRGEPTRIEWGATRVVLPAIPGSAASGVVIQCSGMEGSEIRGASFTRFDGRIIRPTHVLVDDPQTRESAFSPTQCDSREQIIKADILGMAGPGEQMACCITMTVGADDDLAHRLLDRKRNPEFRGEKYRLLESPPKNVELWERYRELREADLMNDGDGSEATEFYRLHREEMDEGAVASWPARYNPKTEISAIQFAMNLKFRDETAFLSEYQNEPVAKIDESGEGMVDAITIINKSSGYKRGVAPLESQLLTGFIDVHKDLLFWAAVAWERNFSGAVVDWGTYPEQKKLNFQLSEARPTLGDVAKKKAFDARQKIPGLEGALTGALETLVETLFERGVQREDGALMRYDRILIDANWGEMTDVVYQFCRRSRFGANLLPSHGMGVGASSRAFGDYKAQRGDVVGLHWRVPNAIGKRSTRHAVIDANFWKSFIHGRLATAPGDPGCLSLNGDPGERGLIASHLTAEYCVPTVNERTGRRVNEWKLRMRRPDNHWFDCLVGACVGASICGAKLPTTPGETAPTRKVRRVSFSELQQRRRRR